MTEQTITACIIDDEMPARDNIKVMLRSLFPNIEVAGEADGVVTGLKLMRSTRPDILFLDVEMQDGTGFDLLNRLEFSNFALIFLTAHSDFAIKAFKYSALDYLLKPLDPDELVTSMHKAFQYLEQKTVAPDPASVPSEPLARRIILKTTESIYIVPVDEIIRLEASGNYTTYFLTDNRKIVVSKTLKDQEALLLPYGFFRVHQSHLINLQHINRINRADGSSVIMSDEVSVPISHRKKDDLMKTING